MEFLAKQRKEMKLDGHNLYVGLSSNLRWIWLGGENVSNGYRLWGPGQPDGDGRCGTLLNYVKRDLKWLGYGWRLNDFSCTRKQNVYGYICEQPLGMLQESILQVLFPTSLMKSCIERIFFYRGNNNNCNNILSLHRVWVEGRTYLWGQSQLKTRLA